MKNKNFINRVALVFAIMTFVILSLTAFSAMAQQETAPVTPGEIPPTMTEQTAPVPTTAPVEEQSGELIWIVAICAFIALIFCLITTIGIFKKDEGNEKMREIAAAVREGANAYLKRQYGVVAIFLLIVFVILWLLVWSGNLNWSVPFAFITGGFFSALGGFIGMKIATRSSARTANAAMKSLNSGLRVAFSSGVVMGFVVVGIACLFLCGWYYLLKAVTDYSVSQIATTMVTFGMGASFVALFARVGGGIYTKAADVGADLVGKIEAGIPEDDPRNPAVIADNVGDNVGDVAGMGADLFESFIGSIVAAMALGAGAFVGTGKSLQGISIPLLVAAVGIIASIIGTFFVRAGERAEQGVLLRALRTGIYISGFLVAIGSFLVVWFVLGREYIGIWGSIITGLIVGQLIGYATEYYTSAKYRPTKSIAEQAETGPATVIIAGLSVGMMSTLIPVGVTCIGIVLSYYFASGSITQYSVMGLYGIGIAAVGMLSTLGITLATDAYGPVADNAGGNAEMAGLPPEVRERTDALDALGNTTAATGKGYAIGSAALTALALVSAYKEEIFRFMAGKEINIGLDNPVLIAGLFLGGLMPFFFSAFTMRAVGRAAGGIAMEVRRQFREIKGLMDGTGKPDYAACVRISTSSAQKQMIVPSLMALIVPILTGVILGVEAVMGLLIGSLVSGFVLAIMMANSGGAWDNAKKYIEAGAHGGKGSAFHKAAVVGDTVGDPFKDTSGPSMNILLKLMSMVALVFAAFTVKFTIFK